MSRIKRSVTVKELRNLLINPPADSPLQLKVLDVKAIVEEVEAFIEERNAEKAGGTK